MQNVYFYSYLYMVKSNVKKEPKMGKKIKESTIETFIKNLKKMYPAELLKGFTRAGRYDLLLGYAFAIKGCRKDDEGRLRFYRNAIVEFTETTKHKYFKEGKPLSVEDVVYLDTETFKTGKKGYITEEREYSDKETEIIAWACSQVDTSKIEPNFTWYEEEKDFVTDKYMNALKEAEKELLEKGTAWDIIAFASYVPHASLEVLEDKIISYGDSLKILAFASDVNKSNKKKLFAAIQKIGNTCVGNITTFENGLPVKVKMRIDHVGIFEDRFGEDLEM